jgi:hypothetical protein
VLIGKDFLDGVAIDTVPFIPREFLSEDYTHDRIYSMGSAHDIRLKGVLDVEGVDFKGRSPFNFFRTIKKFAERQTDESHEKGEVMMKEIR